MPGDLRRSRPGVYVTADATDAADLAEELAAGGRVCFVGDLTAAVDKEGIIATLGAALGAPAWFGHNWDALVDALRDLSWRPAEGYVLLLDGCATPARRATAAWAVLVDICRSTVAWWTDQDVPFHVVLRDPDPLGGFAVLDRPAP